MFFIRQLLCSCLLAVPVSSFAQDFDVPDNVVMKTKEDYPKYEKDIINAAKWLESKPIGVEKEKRKQIDGFVLRWLMGSANVNVSYTPFLMKLFDNNPQYLPIYMAAACRNCLENNYSKDSLQATVAGIKSVITCYYLQGEYKKNKLFIQAVEANKDGKLEDWVKSSVTEK